MRILKKWLYGEIGGGEGLLYKLAWEWIYVIKSLINLPNKLFVKKRIKDYFLSHDLVKIQFGCGDDFLKGFLNTDLLGKIPVNITKKLPFQNETVDLIYSNHTVEHIYHKQFKCFLKESYRIIKPGGIHVISTPSIERITKSVYFDDKAKKMLLNCDSYKNDSGEIDSATLINIIMHMRHMHKFLYDFECINRLAKKQGFKKVFIANKDNLVPDKAIQQNMKDKNSEGDGITETYVLVK